MQSGVAGHMYDECIALCLENCCDYCNFTQTHTVPCIYVPMLFVFFKLIHKDFRLSGL